MGVIGLRIEVMFRLSGMDGAVFAEAAESAMTMAGPEDTADSEFGRMAKLAQEVMERQRASFEKQCAGVMTALDGDQP